MTKKKSAPRLVSDEENRRYFNVAAQKFFSGLGLDPDSLETKIRLGSESEHSPEAQQRLAMVKGLQIPFEYFADTPALFDLCPVRLYTLGLKDVPVCDQ